MIHLETKDNKTLIELRVKAANIFLRTVLFIIALIPIFIILTSLFSGKTGSPFRFFISFIVLGGISAFLFRFLLWNTYGKEIYTIADNQFTAVNDYKLFTDNKKTVDFSKFELFFAHADNPSELLDFDKVGNFSEKEKELFIVFIVDDTPYTSVVRQSKKDIEDFRKTVPANIIQPVITTFTEFN
jgi:hypothetical protein